MKSSRTRPSLGRRVLCMFSTWLFLGAVIGVIEGLAKGGGTQIVYLMISGMMVLSLLGALLGLIGGDAKGSVIGAAGGQLGCGIAGCFDAVPIQAQTLNVIVIFGAIAGATGFLFVRFLLWKYGMMFRAICRVIGVTPVAYEFQRSGNQMLRIGRNDHPPRFAGFAYRLWNYAWASVRCAIARDAPEW